VTLILGFVHGSAEFHFRTFQLPYESCLTMNSISQTVAHVSGAHHAPLAT